MHTGEHISRRHFQTFDALRFFAFFKVFMLHMPFAAFPVFNYLKAGGIIGVQFFFVLSGFLITYIILEEQEQKGQFSLKNFFARRILRIWPLYYLMVAVAYSMPYVTEHLLHISTSAQGYEPTGWVSALFLENYKMMATGQHPNASPLGVMWSLCIEEHFYIVWGLLLFFFKKKYLPHIIAVSIITATLCRRVYVQHGIDGLDLFSNIDLFALGAIPAYLLVARPVRFQTMMSSVPKRIARLFIVVLLAAVITFPQFIGDHYRFMLLVPLLGVMFSTLIAFIVPVNPVFRIQDGNPLSKAGKYTYGLYLYHILVINLLIHLFPLTGMNMNNIAGATTFFIMSMAITFIIAMLSYHLFEKQFLKLKKYFR